MRISKAPAQSKNSLNGVGGGSNGRDQDEKEFPGSRTCSRNCSSFLWSMRFSRMSSSPARPIQYGTRLPSAEPIAAAMQ